MGLPRLSGPQSVSPVAAAQSTDGWTARQLPRSDVWPQLTITRPDGSTHEQRLTNAEVTDALHDDFGLPLTPQEVRELTATLSDYATTP